MITIHCAKKIEGAQKICDPNLEVIQAQGLFLAIGQNPNADLFINKLRINKDGYIETDPHSQATSVQGIFAAGDVQDAKYRQAYIALGHGGIAGLEAISWLRDIGLTDGMSKRLATNYFDIRAIK